VRAPFAFALAVLLAAPPAHADPPVTDLTRDLRFTGGIALTGTGALALIMGTVFSARVFIDKGQIGGHCSPAGQCDRPGYMLGYDAQDSAMLATLNVTIGLAAAAAGTALIVTAVRGRPARTAWIAPGPRGVAAGFAW
jgi:hypothetical protein